MNSNRRILLVQLFSNGDCLYATAVARQIKTDFPDSNLIWAIAGFCKSIIAHNPYVDEILVVDDVPKNDIVAFRKLKRKVLRQKKSGIWDEVFITMNMDTNQALYDGTIRGMILRAYPFPVTKGLQPVLKLTSKEINTVISFAAKNNLKNFKNVILWEFAPQSGQSVLHFDFVMKLAQRIVSLPDTCVILSSGNRFDSEEKIIDASVLSVRENAALTHHCSLLIGCSSGITWISTSDSARLLPMVQLLNPEADFLNAPSIDFMRFKIKNNGLIEITNINESVIYNCISMILNTGFKEATLLFNTKLPLQFNTTRKIVYNLLCYLQFNAIKKHYDIMVSVYGRHPAFLRQFNLAFITFPFKLVKNTLFKRINR